MATKYSSPEIARELCKQFGSDAKEVRVKMRYTEEIGRFIDKVESAQRNTKGSKLTFK